MIAITLGILATVMTALQVGAVTEDEWNPFPELQVHTEFPYIAEGDCLVRSCCAYGQAVIAPDTLSVYEREGDTTAEQFLILPGDTLRASIE